MTSTDKQRSVIYVRLVDGTELTGWRALPWAIAAFPLVLVGLLVVLVSLPEYLVRKWLAMRAARK